MRFCPRCVGSTGATRDRILIIGAACLLGVAGDSRRQTGQACFRPAWSNRRIGTAARGASTGETPVPPRIGCSDIAQLDASAHMHGGRHLHQPARRAMLRAGLKRSALAPEAAPPQPNADDGRKSIACRPRRPRCALLAARGTGALIELTRVRARGGGRVGAGAVCSSARHLEAMHGDWTAKPTVLASTAACARDADHAAPGRHPRCAVERPVVQENTALGAACGRTQAVVANAEGFGQLWKLDRAFAPALPAAERVRRIITRSGKARLPPCSASSRPVRAGPRASA